MWHQLQPASDLHDDVSVEVSVMEQGCPPRVPPQRSSFSTELKGERETLTSTLVVLIFFIDNNSADSQAERTRNVYCPCIL